MAEVTLLALFRLTKHQPETVLPSGVVGSLPLGVNNWPFSYLDYAVARHEAGLARGIYEVDVRPLITMMMYVVRYLAKQDTFRFEYAISFLYKRWERV